jgi:hypothetical protein
MRKETAARCPPTAIVTPAPTSSRDYGLKYAARRHIDGGRRRELDMGRAFIVA